MVFSSLIFLYAFFPLSLLAYALCKSIKARNICLLVFSLIFYAWGEPKYVLLLMLMALFDWAFALGIQKQGEKNAVAKLLVGLSCAVNIGLIGFFKYSGMIASIFGTVPQWVSEIALPLGISFYTFQLLTYVIDVYRGEAVAEREYWHVLLYAALFHQCVAGPIVRYSSISQELFVKRNAVKEMPEGVFRFTTGLAKKVVLANGCGLLADKFLLTSAVIDDASAFSSNLTILGSASVLGLWLGVIGYALQIYFDFSAYSDMAIGMGKMLGLHYPENFNYPYISRSVTEFWRRWHISLSTFFRDYVYIPLGGSRKGSVRTVFNLLVVWAATGLWHGANWNFVLWGLFYFVLLMIEKPVIRARKNKHTVLPLRIIQHIYLLLTVIIGFTIFRFTDIRLIPVVIKGLFGLNGNKLTNFETVINFEQNAYFLAFCVVACTPLYKIVTDKLKALAKKNKLGNVVISAVIYGILPVGFIILSTAKLVGATFNPFLYFRF